MSEMLNIISFYAILNTACSYFSHTAATIPIHYQSITTPSTSPGSQVHISSSRVPFNQSAASVSTVSAIGNPATELSAQCALASAQVQVYP